MLQKFNFKNNQQYLIALWVYFVGVSLEQRSGAKLPAPTQASSSSPAAPPLSSPSVVLGLSTTLNISDKLRELSLQECGLTRCSSNGRCVERNGNTACVCSLGYMGDSCEDNLLKTMQGPLIYAAAGLCAVVAITVMAVVVKRKKSANARFVQRLQSDLWLVRFVLIQGLKLGRFVFTP